MPRPEEVLPGRADPIRVAPTHYVLGTPMLPPFPRDMRLAMFAMGCFWGAEKRFWEMPGVFSTQVGYAGGHTPNPTYQEVCTGLTGHAEVVRVVYDPERVSYEDLLRAFWEGHDPTQGMRQGPDVGTQYRSAIYWHDEDQRRAAEASRDRYQKLLAAAGYGPITTELREAPTFYYAEEDHQQFLAKNPGRSCSEQGTGVRCVL